MLGTIVNAFSIILGSLIGNILKTGLPDNIKNTIMQGLSITIMGIGLSMALKSQNMLVVTLSMVFGAITGELLQIEYHLNCFGENLEKRFGKNEGNFTKAFISASLIYCVGAMAVMGSIESGLTGTHTTLYIKSVLDGVTAIVFASSMGIGVAFSAIPVIIYQGLITLAAAFVRAFLTEAIITEMTAVGGLLIFGIGINMLNIGVNIKVGNLLPAIFIAIFFTIIFVRFPI